MRKDRIVIFCRYPIPGRTKTRLISKLGRIGAANLHRKLTEKTIETVKVFADRTNLEVEICFDRGDFKRMRRWLGKKFDLYKQQKGDLGDRMSNAFIRAFGSGCRNVVLIGTDVPALTSTHIKEAYEALNNYDVVFGPSTDGGYWLIGLNRYHDLFSEINWGSSDVLQTSVLRAKEHRMRVHELTRLDDIDTYNDLLRCRLELIKPGPYISVIIPAINEGNGIASAIKSAKNMDAEVIVVDGGSSDNTVEAASDAGVRILKSRKGRARQQNIGAMKSNGEVLLFLHADSVLPDNYADQIFEIFNERDVVGGSFIFKTDFKSDLMRLVEFATNVRSKYFKLPYGDQGLFVKNDVFESLGGFPDVTIAEDLLMIRKIRKRGFIRIIGAPVITSARRWRSLGVVRTTLINQLILVGCWVGVPMHVLASLCRIQESNKIK